MDALLLWAVVRARLFRLRYFTGPARPTALPGTGTSTSSSAPAMAAAAASARVRMKEAEGVNGGGGGARERWLLGGLQPSESGGVLRGLACRRGDSGDRSISLSVLRGDLGQRDPRV